MRKKPRISPPNVTQTVPPTSFTGTRNAAKDPGLPAPQPIATRQTAPKIPSTDDTQLQNSKTAPVLVNDLRSQEPRRFYFSRGQEPSHGAGKVAGKPPAKVFMEKRLKNVASKPTDVVQAPVADRGTEQLDDSAVSNNQPSGPVPIATQQSQAPLRNTRLPSGKMMPWDATPTQLASEMQAYTLREIGQNIAQTPAPVTQISSPLRKPLSRFKPKAPALRYNERHPEAAAQELEDQSLMDGDDDSKYVLETYIRMPIEMFQSVEQTKNFGLLVLDSQPDIDEFYNDDSDDDSEIYDEEEDENGLTTDSRRLQKLTYIAENHPSTDYPEDEVASDDEYDRNPYRFRNRNASDEEEFDEDDATFSEDDDNEESRKPAWARRTWKMGQPLHDEVI